MTDEEITARWGDADGERGPAAQRDAIAKWKADIAGSDNLAVSARFDLLGGALRKASRYNIFQVRERFDLYDIAQQKILSFPGHAEYFAELVEKERAALKPGEFRSDYDRNRCLFLRDTLRHLPSPETVSVLGRYLEDDRDIPPPPKPRGDVGEMPTTSIISMESLMLLEIRDAPYPPGRYYAYPSTKELSTVRAWFAPIRSGEQPFSFKGQSVEYRFKPDGTWTITPIARPPDDAPKPVPRTEPPPPAKPGPPSLATPPPPPAKPPGLPWPWIGAGVLTIIAALAALLKSRGKSGT